MVSYSFNTRIRDVDTVAGTNGYGYATKCMLRSWDNLEFEWGVNDALADVAFAFDMPHEVKWESDKQYKILFTPWESTELLPGWADIMNECDEIWTPSPLIADWYRRYAGVKVPVHVYQHGIEPDWSPVKREPEHTIKFLHVGAEATRKGGFDVVRAFRRAFPGREDVSLTLKMVDSGWNQIPSLGRVTYLNKRYDFNQLLNLFHYHDVYTYPSAGEGFGFTPLQALATGMPTITVPAWAPYAEFLDPRLSLDAELVKSSWPKIHPGKVFRPNFDELIDNMRFAADNYESIRDFACQQSFAIHEKYNWDNLTKEAFSSLEKRLK